MHQDWKPEWSFEDVNTYAEQAYTGTGSEAQRERAIKRYRTALATYLTEVQERGFRGATARTEAVLDAYGFPSGTVGHVSQLWRDAHEAPRVLNKIASDRPTREEFDTLCSRLQSLASVVDHLIEYGVDWDRDQMRALLAPMLGDEATTAGVL